MILLALVAAFAAFTLSASAGLGGSLILVPALSLLLGPKEGVAVAALMLGANNIAKTIAYRRQLPYRAAALVLVVTVAGAAIGASALLAASERVVSVAILTSFVLALVFERLELRGVQRAYAPVLAFGGGLTSGFSGTSGPLKGVAIRSLGLDRAHFVGAASLVSLANDAAKAVVFTSGSLVSESSWVLVAAAVPLMALGTATGRMINQGVGERAFAGLFWAVMLGYSVRLAVI